MIEVWRIVKEKFHPLDGEGAKKYDGRWHHRGYPCIYTSGSLALATLEKLVQLNEIGFLENYRSSLIKIPKKNIEKLNIKNIPVNWNSYPHSPETRTYGTNWLQSLRSSVLEVPSAIVEREYNYLINPSHPEFKEIKLLETFPFIFDKRVFKKTQK